MRQAVAAAESINTGMLKKAPDDRFDADVFRQTWHAGTQAADAAHDDLDAHAGAAGGIKRIDDFRINQRIALQPDRRRLLSFGELDLLRDMSEQFFLERDRRDRHPLETA